MERQISPTLRLALRGPAQAIASPLFAINWFDARFAPLYHLYNALAAGSVRRVGAQPFFKGELIETLAGDLALARRFLLIVRYPCGANLLDLLSSRFFQVISILRILTVKDFSFVLHDRVDESPPHPLRREDSYAIHHFDSKLSLTDELARIQTVISESGLSLHFASELAVTLESESKDAEWSEIEYVTRKVILFRAADAVELTSFLRNDYASFSSTVRDSYIGRMQRTL